MVPSVESQTVHIYHPIKREMNFRHKVSDEEMRSRRRMRENSLLLALFIWVNCWWWPIFMSNRVWTHMKSYKITFVGIRFVSHCNANVCASEYTTTQSAVGRQHYTPWHGCRACVSIFSLSLPTGCHSLSQPKWNSARSFSTIFNYFTLGF